jgi:hypothetical protein
LTTSTAELLFFAWRHHSSLPNKKGLVLFDNRWLVVFQYMNIKLGQYHLKVVPGTSHDLIWISILSLSIESLDDRNISSKYYYALGGTQQLYQKMHILWLNNAGDSIEPNRAGLSRELSRTGREPCHLLTRCNAQHAACFQMQQGSSKLHLLWLRPTRQPHQ